MLPTNNFVTVIELDGSPVTRFLGLYVALALCTILQVAICVESSDLTFVSRIAFGNALFEAQTRKWAPVVVSLLRVPSTQNAPFASVRSGIFGI